MNAPQIQNIYRLSALQEGMLFHSVVDDAAAFYVDQVSYRIVGELDPNLFARAWELLAARHEVLRASFHWQGISEPVQVVHDTAQVPIQHIDWRDLPAEQIGDRLEEFLRADRLEGFKLDQPPLIRLTLIRVPGGEHRLVFRYHHVLLDAWSGLMALNEAMGFYDELAAGRTPQVAPAPSFRDYVRWARGQDLAAAERFWRRELAGVTEPTSLPINISPGARTVADTGPTDRRDNPEITLRVSGATLHSLNLAARELRFTLSALLQVCWALLLSRYTGKSDVVFGGTMSSRPAELPDVTRSVGLFISTLPVRVALRSDESVAEAARRLQADQAKARRYDFSPLAQIQQWSDLPAGSALFDTIVTVLNVPGIDSLRRRDGVLSLRDGDYRYRTNYALSLLVIPEEEGLTLRVSYDPDRVRDEDAARLLGHLGTIVKAVAEAPDGLVGGVPMLGVEEDRQLRSDWAHGPAGYDYVPAHRHIEEMSDRFAAAVAVRYGNRTIDYADLDRRANRLAHHLRAAGVGPDVRVGLCLPRGPEHVVAMLAVLKAGGCFLPLDPDHPPARLAAIVAEANVQALVTDSHRQALLPRTRCRAVLVDSHATAIGEHPSTRLEWTPRAGDVAYIIYTSGSTGRPKGVMLTHGGLANLLQAQRTEFDVRSGDRVLQWAAATFDASVFEVMLALGAGAELHLADQEQVAPGENLAGLLRERRITVLTITPSALAATAAGELPDLRLLIIAGEVLPPELVGRWASGRRVVNAYGPTEATVWATAGTVLPDSRTPPIGRPVRNVVARVLDGEGRLVPVGVPGELCLGGPGVARGYVGQPGLTAARFLPDPLGTPGARIYRTGDVVRWRPDDGQLEFLGRRDGQVKIRGFRIETTEVAAALRAVPGIVDCAVIARGDVTGLAHSLVAYLVGAGHDPATLRTRLGEVLPEYMIPNVFVTVDRLPLTSNGKLDEAALPDPEAAATRSQVGKRPVGTVAEKAVAALWTQVLGIEGIGADDDFFELGGNSIRATQVVSRARRAWQVDLPVRSVLESRTVAQFAQVLQEALEAQELDAGDGS